MFRTTDIQSSLLRLIGWRQNDDQQSFKIHKDLLKSDSGKVYQQAHALLTLQNIRAIAPDYDNYLYNAWDNLTTYVPEDKVEHNLAKFKCIKECTDVTPVEGEFWTAFDPFSDWLDNKVRDSISKAINHFIDMKMAYAASKSLAENKVLFDGAGSIREIDTTSTGIAGFELVPNRSRSVSLRIDRFGIQFTEAVKLKVYVHHSSQVDPVYSFEFDYTKPNSMQWFTEDTAVILPYFDGKQDAGGSYYVSYQFVDLTTSRPIVKSRDWSAVPCYTCEQSAVGANLLSKFVEVYPFNAKVDYTDTNKLWDIEQNEYTQYNNHGLNLELSVVCDYTDVIITQKQIFSKVILLQFATDMLREMAYNPNTRVNRNSAHAQRSELIFALDGDTSSMRKSGLSYELETAFKSLDVDFSGIDRVCLPTKNGGLKYRTI